MSIKTFSNSSLSCKYGSSVSCRPLIRANKKLSNLCTRRLYGGVVTRVSETEKEKTSGGEEFVDDCSYNVGEFCSIDDKGKRIDKLTLGEKEAQFIQALQSWYFEGKSVMSDEEFENLKEELIWSGSKIATLSSKEQKFIEASVAYQSGKAIMTDEEYDQLKLQLKMEDSFVTLQGPRCSIRSGKMYSDSVPDYNRMLLLNVPAVLLVLLVVFGIDDVTGFEITKFIELPSPYGIIALWGVTLPLLYIISSSLTDLVFKDAMILKGPCPNCGAENLTYFGNIFTVQGNQQKNMVKCTNCGSELQFDAVRREIVVAEKEEEAKQPANAQ
eukprot:TRINITY_DN176_c1_g1_i1.p1 TRINITY_DN176_c1_g1~~TRINITY_DN176_c1_g1_i1.p1  ORF type:complete len:328 (+),score=33.80 TRINITY_DN176_c1_g1_i1:69-1052(+)